VGHSERTRNELREALKSVDLFDGDGGHEWTVRELDDDDAILLGADGQEVTPGSRTTRTTSG